MKRLLTAYITAFLCALQLVAQPICTATKYDYSQGHPLWHVTQILQDSQGMIWFSTWNGLVRFDGNEMVCFKSQVGDGCNIPSDRIRSIFMLENDKILCVFDDKRFVFDPITCRFTEVDNEMTGRRGAGYIADVGSGKHTDANGTEWTIYTDGRLEYLDEKSGKWIEYTLPEPLGKVYMVFSDRQGNLWTLATHRVWKLVFAQHTVDMLDMESSVAARCFFIDTQERYWVAGREDATLKIFDADNRELGYLTASGRLSKGYASFGASAYCMTQTADGTIWVGCKPEGLYRMKELRQGVFSIEHIDRFGDFGVYDITEDAQGRLWIATLGAGLCCIPNPQQARPEILTPDDGLTGYSEKLCRKARRVVFTDDGTMLVATTEGLLVKPSDGPFRLHSREADRVNSLSCSAVIDIVQDSKGRIFIATESGGVNMILSDSLNAESLDFRHHSTATGFPTDITLSVVEADDKLIVVGNTMIVELDAERGVQRIFDSHFLRSSYRFSEAHPVQLPDGRWLFGLLGCAFAVTPDSLERSTFVPKIALSDILVQNNEHITTANSMDTLTLQPDGRNATIRFSALDYTDTEVINYAFRFCDEEADSVWHNIGRTNSVTLLDLVPGEYLLQIRSTNADGVWVENTRSLTIIVVPKFSETGFAKFLFILLIVIIKVSIILTIIYIRRIHRKQRELLEAYLALLNKPEDETDDEEEAETPPNARISTEDDRLMKRITAFVEQHIADADITIADMADAAAISRSGLQRKVKQLFGITPLDFLREARIKRASHLLATTDMNISEIAFSCGFSDPKYFSRTFKATTGKTPKEYRENGE